MVVSRLSVPPRTDLALTTILAMVFRSALLIAGSLCLIIVARADEPRFDAEDIEYYERKIRPLLSEHCYACHASQGETVHGGLRLDGA